MKKSNLEVQFFEELRKIPIVQVACEKSGISRNSIYRWRKEDPAFAQKMDDAINDGVAFVNDMSESQLLTMIKDRNFKAVAFWLRYRHNSYKQKVEVQHKSEDAPLTDEQKKVVAETLSILKASYE